MVTQNCACCGGTVTREPWRFGSADGYRDLDTRPSEPMRSALGQWVMRCPHCGYCARQIDEDCTEAVRTLVGSPEYRARLDDPALPAKANEFNSKAFLDLRTGRAAQGFWALVHAAWICDDRGHGDASARFRRDAVRIGRTLLSEGKSVAGEPFCGDPGDTEAILADLLRRAGEFTAAAGMADAGLAKRPGKLAYLALTFQRARARDGDAAPYRVDRLYWRSRRAAPDPLPEPAADAAEWRPLEGSREAAALDAHESAEALLSRGRQAFGEGKHERAERALREAIDAFRGLDPVGDRRFTAVNELGLVLKKTERLAEAADCFRRAHEHFLARHGIGYPDTAVTLHNLGATLTVLGDVEGGARMLQRALELMLEKGHVRPIEIVNNYATLSENFVAQGDLDRGVEFLEKSIALRETLEPPQHVELADHRLLVCDYEIRRGRLGAAEAAARRAIAYREAGLGPYHRDTADACNQLGVVLTSLGRLDEAEHAFRDALARLEESATRGDLFAVTARSNLADVLSKQGRAAEAVEMAREALRFSEDGLGAEHPKTARALELLGDLLRRNERPGEAVPLLTRARALHRTQEGADSARYALTVNSLALALRDCGAREEAVPLFNEALDILGREFGPGCNDACTIQTNLASCLTAMGAFDEAERLLGEIVAVRLPRAGERAWSESIAMAAFHRAELARRRGDHALAYERFQAALKQFEDCFGPESWQVARCCDELWPIARAAGLKTDAYVFAERAHAIRVTLHGIEHPDALSTFRSFLQVAGERDADRAMVVAMRAYEALRRLPAPSDRALGVYQTALGQELVRNGRGEDGALLLEHGLRANFRLWNDDPALTLEDCVEFAEACLAAGRHDRIVTALRAILARCEETPGIADSWPAALRVWIVRALLLLGRGGEAMADARLAWAWYQRPRAAQPWTMAAPWVHWWLAANAASRERLAPWYAILPGDAAGALRVLRIRFADEDADAVEQVLNEFHLLAGGGLRLRNVDLPAGPWLLDGGEDSGSRVLADARALLDPPADRSLKTPPFDPAAPVAAVEICGSRVAVCCRPGAAESFLRLQTDIVHALMRFQAVRVLAWDSGCLPAGAGPRGYDAEDFFEALRGSSEPKPRTPGR